METTIKAIQILITADHFDYPLNQIMQYHKAIDEVWESLEDVDLHTEFEFSGAVGKFNDQILFPLEEMILDRLDMNLGIEIQLMYESPGTIQEKVARITQTMFQLDYREKYIFVLLFSSVLETLPTDEVMYLLEEIASIDEDIAAIFVSSEYFCRQMIYK